MPRIRFSSRELRLAFDGSSVEFPPAYSTKVEKYWAKINHEGRFFNGPVLSASSIPNENEDSAVHMQLTDYAHYLYAAQDDVNEFDCRAVFSAAVVLTCDNYILLGQMSSHTSAPSQIQCPGGGIELDSDGQLDAKLCCQREVIEELGPDFGEKLERYRPLCMKSGGDLSTVGIFYALRLDMTAEQAQYSFSHHRAALCAAGERPEFDCLHAVKFERRVVAEFVQTNREQVVDYLAPIFLSGWPDVFEATASP
ncbi:hypothetical protein EDF70_11623 [Neorhizobium sp. JUb45]|nr:hypothetical protein EDF70_11623 [Neorhizobium sp. JUb45]